MQTPKLFEAAKLQNIIVITLDDKLIISIEVISGLIIEFGSSISFNPIQKQKQDAANNKKPSKNTILSLETIEKQTTDLAKALVRTKRVLSLLIVPVVLILIA